MGVLRLVAAVALAGCRFQPALEDGRVRCGAGGACPPGFSCSGDRCYRELFASVSPDLFGGEDLGDVAPSCAPSECPIGSRCVSSGDSTGVGRVCSNGADVPCGFPGARCCPQYVCGGKHCCIDDRCVANGDSCGNGATCMEGACGECGAAGKICCAVDHASNLAPSYCTQGGTACRASDNKCVACGGKDDECCAGNRCSDGMCCDGVKNKCVAAGGACSDGSLCVNGGCQGGGCGRLGQPACGGEVGCTEPSTDPFDGVCVACGRPDQRCCPATGGQWCAPPFVCGLDGICR